MKIIILLLLLLTTPAFAQNCDPKDHKSMYVGQPIEVTKRCFPNTGGVVRKRGEGVWKNRAVEIYEYQGLYDYKIYVENGKVVGWREYR